MTTVSAGDVEAAVLAQLQNLLTAPEMISRVWTAAMTLKEPMRQLPVKWLGQRSGLEQVRTSTAQGPSIIELQGGFRPPLMQSVLDYVLGLGVSL